MKTRDVLLHFVLGVLCAYHLGIGVFACLAPETTLQFASWFYDVHASTVAPQVVYMLKALGMYALFTGGLVALSMTDAARFRHIIFMVAGLLLVRALVRVVFYDVLNEAFAVEWSRNLINVAMLVVQASVLIACAPADPHAQSSPEVDALPSPLLASALASASQRLSPLATASGLHSGMGRVER